MPLYEYECTTCHRRLEKIQKFSDAELTVCPHCDGKLERTITAAAFSFQGGGWYKDGYGSAKPASGGDSGSGSGDSAAPTSTNVESSAGPATPSTATPAPAASAPASTSTPSTSKP